MNEDAQRPYNKVLNPLYKCHNMSYNNAM